MSLNAMITLSTTISGLARVVQLGALVLPLLAGPAMAASISDGGTSLPSGTDANQRVAFLIRGGCPYNLDKVCRRTRNGRLVCHCAS